MFRRDPLFDRSGSSKIHELEARIALFQLLRDRQGREHVPARAASRKRYFHAAPVLCASYTVFAVGMDRIIFAPADDRARFMRIPIANMLAISELPP